MVAGAGLVRVAVDLGTAEVIGDFSAAVLLAVALGLVGLLDDIRPLPRAIRLAAQIGAALVAWEIGFRVHATDSNSLSLAITLLWIVGITNAFNLLDNMDGLSAGLAGVSALSFAAMGVVGDLPIVAIVAASLSGAAFGFLAHNRHPAKVYMGDAGSLFLGFLLALIGIEVRFENLVEVTFLVPVVTLGLPIFDTALVVLSRLRHRRPVFLGGRDHVSHRLVKMGLPVKFSVGLLYWVGLCLGWLGLVVSRANTQVGWMLLGFVFALGAFFGVLLWRVPIYEDEPKVIPQTHADAEILDQVPPARETVAR
jgi:UDP-GlcNAc:undecaprenyl-phosphate GlcNAc-1-phosphate transferase